MAGEMDRTSAMIEILITLVNLVRYCWWLWVEDT
jgi:hypothetical protein